MAGLISVSQPNGSAVRCRGDARLAANSHDNQKVTLPFWKRH